VSTKEINIRAVRTVEVPVGFYNVNEAETQTNLVPKLTKPQ